MKTMCKQGASKRVSPVSPLFKSSTSWEAWWVMIFTTFRCERGG